MTIVSLVVVYAVLFGLFVCAQSIAKLDTCRTFHSGLKAKDPRRLLLFCVLSIFMTLYVMLGLVRNGVPLQYFMAIPTSMILYLFSRGIFRKWKFPMVSSLVFSGGITLFWLVSKNWFVIDISALFIALAILVLFSGLSFRQCVIFSLFVVALDVFSVFQIHAMQELALGSEISPTALTIPDFFISGTLMTGLGDIVVPGIVVMTAFKKARDLKAPLLGYLVSCGYVIGLAVVDYLVINHSFAQPATLYLLPAVLVTFILTARIYGISFSQLWKEKT